MKKLLIAIPTYNERENAPLMCRAILDLKLDAELLFVDDASPDGTGMLLDQLAAHHPAVHVLHRAGKQGIGSAHQAAVAWAYDHDYARLLTMDCDFSHSPADIPRIIGASGSEDVVVGSRYLQKGSLSEWNLLRRFLTNAGHFMTVSVLGLPQDATGAFRLYDLEALPRELFALVESRGYAFFFESLFVLVRNGATIKEIPIDLPARTYGSSKMSISEAFRSLRRVLALWWQWQLNRQRFLLPQSEKRHAE